MNEADMKIVALWVSLFFFFVLFCAVIHTVVKRHFPFVRKIEQETREAYVLLTVVAIALFAWANLNLHVESVEIAGVRATVGQLQQKVETLLDQMEIFFKSKRIETFNRKNWNRVKLVHKSKDGVILQVQLEQEPIPGSVEVYEGVLLMPEQEYRIERRTLQFPANTDKPVDGLTIKYYPRASAGK
jgi:hypothetical protein